MKNHHLAVIVMTVFIYVYIHNPFITFLGGIGTIAYLFPLLFMLLKDKDAKLLFKKNKDLILLSLGGVIYCAIKFGLGGEFGNFRQSIYYMLTTDLLVIPLVVLVSRWRLNLGELLVINGFVAASITILCLFLPSVNQVIKSFLIQTVDLYEKRQEGIRGFGLSNEFLYGYGLAMGTIVAYAVYKQYIVKFWFGLYVLVCSLAILVNARTGIIIVIISIVYYFISCQPKVQIRKYVPFFLSIAIPPFFVIGILDSSVVEFVTDFFSVFYSLYVEGDVSGGGALSDMSKMIVTPTDLSGWIWGTGRNLIGNSVWEEHSDIGFINQLYYGGLIYLFLLIAIIYRLTRRVRNRYWRIMCWMIFIVSNIKGDVFIGCGNMRLFYFIIINEYWAHIQNISIKLRN